MPGPSFEFTAELYPWDARVDSWVFARLPDDVSDEIADHADAAGPRRGFGAVAVRVRCGLSAWQTSVFPSAKDAAYVLPVKKSIRAKRGLEVGDQATFSIELVM